MQAGRPNGQLCRCSNRRSDSEATLEDERNKEILSSRTSLSLSLSQAPPGLLSGERVRLMTLWW